MGKLFERLVRIVGAFRTTKTMNKRTGRVKTTVKRVKPKTAAPKKSRSRSGPRK